MSTCTIRFEHRLSEALIAESMTAGGIIQAINKQRKLKKLTPAQPNETLEIAATIQARQMTHFGQFGHVIKGAKYPKLSDRMRAVGIDMQAGEVLYAGADDPEMAVQAWLGSKPHREAILHPDIREIGASVERSNGRAYACAVVCIPNNSGKAQAATVGDEIIQTAKDFGKVAAQKLLTKVAQSDKMKDVMKSPIIKKIIAALR